MKPLEKYFRLWHHYKARIEKKNANQTINNDHFKSMTTVTRVNSNSRFDEKMSIFKHAALLREVDAWPLLSVLAPTISGHLYDYVWLSQLPLFELDSANVGDIIYNSYVLKYTKIPFSTFSAI